MSVSLEPAPPAPRRWPRRRQPARPCAPHEAAALLRHAHVRLDRGGRPRAAGGAQTEGCRRVGRWVGGGRSAGWPSPPGTSSGRASAKRPATKLRPRAANQLAAHRRCSRKAERWRCMRQAACSRVAARSRRRRAASARATRPRHADCGKRRQQAGGVGQPQRMMQINHCRCCHCLNISPPRPLPAAAHLNGHGRGARPAQQLARLPPAPRRLDQCGRHGQAAAACALRQAGVRRRARGWVQRGWLGGRHAAATRTLVPEWTCHAGHA